MAAAATATIIPVTPALNASSLTVSDCETIETSPNQVLLNTFCIRKKDYSVSLDAEKLVYERSKTKSDRTIILVENILAIQSQVTKNSSVPEQNAETPKNIKQFTIFYAKRIEASSNPNKWRHFSQTFQNSDSNVCQLWIDTLQRRIDGKS